MHEFKKGRNQLEILADVLGEYQERCAKLRGTNDILADELVRLRLKVRELGGEPDDQA